MTVLPHVAFIGKAGAGKTTAAELLVKHFEYERLSFAAPLKVMCGTTTDRTLLQDVGCGVRDLVEDGWVNLLVHDIHNRPVRALRGDEAFELGEPRFVVDDCRFPNEAARLRMEGFIIVRVSAGVAIRTVRLRANGKLQDEAQLEHVSETALDDFEADYRIVNDGWSTEMLEDLTDILNKERR